MATMLSDILLLFFEEDDSLDWPEMLKENCLRLADEVELGTLSNGVNNVDDDPAVGARCMP